MINGEPNYEIQLGCVSETVRRNWQNDEYNNRITDIRNDDPCRGTWLVIDEFNRADIDKAFGQLFTSLESRKLKVPATNKIGYNEMIIPQDYRIICTLNTADKHYLFHLSDALKRRFAYIEVNSPSRAEKESEIYYALKNAMEQLPEGDYSSLVVLDHTPDKKIIDQEKSNKEFTLMIEKAYAVLDFVRFSKPLGTAILKSMYQTMLVASLMDINYDKVLDFGLRTNLIPQLETVSPTTLETIIEVFYGKPIEFFEDIYNNQPNKEKYKDDFIHLLDFMELGEGYKKQLSDQFTKNQLKPDSWNELRNRFDPKYTLKEKLFKTSLQDLIKSSILI